MSRSATATPPLPYFPAKLANSSTRHSSPSNVSKSHFSQKPHTSKKARKHGFGSSGKPKATGGVPSESTSPTLEHASGFTMIQHSGVPLTRQPSSASVLTFQSIPSTVDTDGSYNSAAPPSMTHTLDSSLSLPLQTPDNGSVVSLPSFVQPQPESPEASRGSWTSNFGKMAKAVVHTGRSMGIQFADRKKRDSVSASPAPVQPSQLVPAPLPAVPSTPAAITSPAPAQSSPEFKNDCCLPSLVAVPRPTRDELAKLDPQEAMTKRREWAEAENQRVLECAKLCSQWPQSGYNQSKWGPNGAKAFYEPQSYANPSWVAAVMKRQADIEQQLKSTAATYFTCRRTREPSASVSDDGSDETSESYTSSQSSPTIASRFENEQRTIADIKAAMDSTIMVDGPSRQPSPPSSLAGSVPSLRGTKSINELDAMASSMALSSSSRDVNAMDVDLIENSQPEGSLSYPRHERAQSCGSKRPLNLVEAEEEKRRKVDEAMVVKEAVSTGVIMPTPVVDSIGQNRAMSASTPDLSSPTKQSPPQQQGLAMFGHVVKTSDTHPIIISPLFPSALLATLATHLVRPEPQTEGASPMMLKSQVDVPSLLLNSAPSGPTPDPMSQSPTRKDLKIDTKARPLGNMLLSSCPGKRLRMEGPVKGRAPVCRDLETDLRRIKNEGVGCLVCCLDDAELALLGVPWETYRSIAAKIGLDVIRVPMPDGLTPVSIQMFDTQIELICRNYTLEGINVLVHCRGGVGRAGLTASAWAIKMGFVGPHYSLQLVIDANIDTGRPLPLEVEHQAVMSIVERVIAMIRSRRGLKAIESFEQVQFLATYTSWLRRHAGVNQSP